MFDEKGQALVCSLEKGCRATPNPEGYRAILKPGEEHFFPELSNTQMDGVIVEQRTELPAHFAEEECETISVLLTPFSALTLMSVADVCMDLRKDDTHKSLKQIFTGDMKIMSNHSGPFMAQKRSAVLHRFPSHGSGATGRSCSVIWRW